MDENIERLSELVRKPQLTMIGAPPTIDALGFAFRLFGKETWIARDEFSIREIVLHKIKAGNGETVFFEGDGEPYKRIVVELQSMFYSDYSDAREYDFCLSDARRNAVMHGIPVIALADFTKNAFNTPAELSSFTGNARLVYTADAVLAMQRFQNAIRVSCLKAPWKNYAAWKEPLIDFFVEYEPETRSFHEVPAPELTPLNELNHINTRKRSARK